MLGEKSSAETVKKNGEMVRRSYGTVDTFVTGEGEKTKKRKVAENKKRKVAENKRTKKNS